jgi:adenine-specific DNA-methyltransferase
MTDMMDNIDKLHTTALGAERIRRNLNLQVENVVLWCKRVRFAFAMEVHSLNLKETVRIMQLARLVNGNHFIILDFFSGSATTAHAVMQLNAEDGGKRKFIMVQLPEICAEGTEAAKAGYKNICEIGKERIRRAGAKIKADNPLTTGSLDVGFRILKLDSTNMKDVYYTPEEYAQMNFSFDGLADNIKEDRTGEDLLFQIMLELGIPLSAKITQEGDVYYVNDNYLIACFKRVDTALITEIAKQKPYYAVFRDSSFASDSAMVNFEQAFNTYSPSTIRRVL